MAMTSNMHVRWWSFQSTMLISTTWYLFLTSWFLIFGALAGVDKRTWMGENPHKNDQIPTVKPLWIFKYQAMSDGRPTNLVSLSQICNKSNLWIVNLSVSSARKFSQSVKFADKFQHLEHSYHQNGRVPRHTTVNKNDRFGMHMQYQTLTR
jgi:hypothetical protein